MWLDGHSGNCLIFEYSNLSSLNIINQWIISEKLLPFNSAGGFGADIVYHAVNARDFVDNSVGKGAE